MAIVNQRYQDENDKVLLVSTRIADIAANMENLETVETLEAAVFQIEAEIVKLRASVTFFKKGIY